MTNTEFDFYDDLLDLLGDIYVTYGRKGLIKLLGAHDEVRNNLVAYLISKEVKNEKHL